MAENVRYFALIHGSGPGGSPSGLARRTNTPQGQLDEVLRADLTWKRDSVIYEWERGEEMGTNLIEVSEAEAEGIVEKFREKWRRSSE